MHLRSKSACLLFALAVAGAATADVVWETALPSAYGCRLNGCCSTDDGGLVAVGALGTPDREITSFYMAKISPQGGMQWEMSSGWGASSTGHDVLQAGSGYLVCGELTTRRGDRDGFLIHLDYFGLEIWHRRLGGEGDDSLLDIAAAPGGGFYLTGYTVSEEGGDKDLWLMSVDSEGGIIWSRTYGDSCGEAGYGMCVTPDSVLAVCGSCDGDMLLLLADGEGEPIHYGTFDTGGIEYGRSIAVMADGGLRMGGSVRPGGSFLMDAFLLATDSAGGELWRATSGGAGNDCGACVLPMGDSLLVVYNTMSEGRGSYDAALELRSGEGLPTGRMLVGDSGWNRVCDAEAGTRGGVFLVGGTGPAAASECNGWVVLVDFETEAGASGVEGDVDDEG